MARLIRKRCLIQTYIQQVLSGFHNGQVKPPLTHAVLFDYPKDYFLKNRQKQQDKIIITVNIIETDK